MFEFLNGLTSGSESIGLSPWDALFKSTLVLGMAAIICRLLRRQSAALRHRVWVLGIVTALAVPWIGLLVPQISVAVLPAPNTQSLRTGEIELESSSPRTIQAPTGAASINQDITSPPSLTTESTGNPALGGDQGNHQSSTSPTHSGAASLFVNFWLAGTAITATLFLASLFRQSFQLRRLPAVDDPDWNAAVATAALSLGLHKTVPTVESQERCVPAVVGVLRPKLVVPREWRSWSESQRHCILLHELAHVKRRDVATQLLGRLAWVTYWFHPLMWSAVRQLRIERELAADDCVLLAGQTASDYAEQLLRTLRSCRTHRMALGVAMAHSARLDERVRAILDPNRRRKPVGVRLGLVLLGAVAAIGAVLGGVKLVAGEADAESPADSRPAEPPPEPKTMWRENFTIEYPGTLPVSVDFSGDGETLLTGDTNGEVMALIFKGDEPLWSWKSQVGGKHAAIVFSADQKLVYATFKDGVRILGANDGKEVAKIDEPATDPTAIGVFPDQPVTEEIVRSQIVFGNPRGYFIKSWVPGKLPESLGTISTSTTAGDNPPADAGALPLAVDPKGRSAIMTGPIDATGDVSGTKGQNVLWAYVCGDYSEGSPGNRVMAGHKAVVVCAAWSQEGSTAVTGDADGRVIVWDAETMKESRRLELGGRVLSLAVSSDGSQSAAWVAGDKGCELHLWETSNPPAEMKPIHTEVGDFDGPTAFADLDFSPDGKRLAGCAGDKKWLSRLGELIGKVHVWEVANEPRAQLPPKQVYTKSLPQGSSSNFVILNNHTLLAPASKAGAVDMRDIATGDIQARIVLGQFDVGRIKLSSDRKWLAIVQSQRFDPNTTAPPSREFDVGVYQSVLQLKTTIPGCLQLLDIASGGEVIAVVREAGIEIWDIATTKVLQTAPFDHIRIDAAAISPDGKLLAISDRGTLVLWNWETNEFETIKLGRNLDSLTFSPDGKYLAEGPDSRREIQIRDIETRQIVQSLDNGTELSMHVRSTAFSQGGRLLIGSDDITYIESITVPYRINLWDTTSGKLAHQLASPPGELPYAVGVTPNGRYLVASSEEWKTGAVKLSTWRLDSEIPPRDPGPKPPATTADP